MKMQKIIKKQPSGRFQYDWEHIVQYGKEHPGETFTPLDENGEPKVYPQSLIGSLSRGGNRLIHSSEWEFYSRNNTYDPMDGRRYCNIYFTYVGNREKE